MPELYKILARKKISEIPEFYSGALPAPVSYAYGSVSLFLTASDRSERWRT